MKLFSKRVDWSWSSCRLDGRRNNQLVAACVYNFADGEQPSSRMKSQLKEFGLGATAACGACFFTNPLEVVKTRMQLQGELKARGTYAVHYKNAFHAFYTIGRYDGLRSLQSGLAPALVYQAVMNGCRLGSYQVFTNLKLTANSKGEIEFWRCLVAGAVAGAFGAFLGSPAYMVSTETLLAHCISVLF